jgi:hypothetical protein
MKAFLASQASHLLLEKEVSKISAALALSKEAF